MPASSASQTITLSPDFSQSGFSQSVFFGSSASGLCASGSSSSESNFSGPTSASPVKAHAIIPARYASTRFPGKPLVDIGGKPMFWHVWNRATQCAQMRSVTLATDDDRIAKAAEQYGVPCVMTRSDHSSGTDRVHEAATLMGLQDSDIIVNIQGDEPALHPQSLTQLIALFSDPSVQAGTLARPLPPEQSLSPDVVKVVCAKNGDALYFSRARIPHDRDDKNDRDASNPLPYLGHVGIYAFRMNTLRRFVSLPPSALEEREKLEQLRLLENNIPIRVALTKHVSPGVDRPEDIARVLPYLNI